MEHRLKGEDRLNENASAETPEEAARGQPPDAADQRSYWDEVPQFRKMWADHEGRWPTERRPAPDRSADPPGSYRSDGGFYLNPERHAETIAAIGRMREAEPGISADVRATEQQNGYGGWLEGFDRRLKGEGRLKEKVAERREGESDKTSAEIMREVPDAIRYTFCLRSDTYTKGYYDIKERLESCGYEMYYSENHWTNAEYKGIKEGFQMPDKITFYAIVGGNRTVDNPYGLVRRLAFDGDGFTDEALRKDFSWKFTPLIAEWEHGDFEDELVEVSHNQVEKIIQYFRERWGPFGQPLDS